MVRSVPFNFSLDTPELGKIQAELNAKFTSPVYTANAQIEQVREDGFTVWLITWTPTDPSSEVITGRIQRTNSGVTLCL